MYTYAFIYEAEEVELSGSLLNLSVGSSSVDSTKRSVNWRKRGAMTLSRMTLGKTTLSV